MSERLGANLRALACMISLFAFLVPPDVAASNGYTAVELGALPGGSGIARDLSGNGNVAGRSGFLHGTQTQAFVWSADHVTEPIGVLP